MDLAWEPTSNVMIEQQGNERAFAGNSDSLPSYEVLPDKSLDRCLSNINMYTDHLEVSLKGRSCFSSPGMEPESLTPMLADSVLGMHSGEEALGKRSRETKASRIQWFPWCYPWLHRELVLWQVHASVCAVPPSPMSRWVTTHRTACQESLNKEHQLAEKNCWQIISGCCLQPIYLEFC